MFCFYLHRLKCLWRKISISAFERHPITGTKYNKEMSGTEFTVSIEYANCWPVSESTNENWFGIFLTNESCKDQLIPPSLKAPTASRAGGGIPLFSGEREEGFDANSNSKKKNPCDLCVSFVDVNTSRKDWDWLASQSPKRMMWDIKCFL